jgi:2-polyprenyl-3-methyl-5-hydroxy-6-metoxy-1,4-benzoquinol methylase
VVSDDPAVLKQRYEKRSVDTPFFSSRRFETLLDKGRVASVYRQLRQWPKIVNTDTLPIVYLAGLQLWERSLPGNRSAGDATWTGALERFAWLWLVIPLLLWAGIQILLRKRSQPNRPTGAVLAIATTGAAGMAVEIMVIYVFQIASGQLYTGLALLVALFMAGLTMGAFIGRRYLSKGQVLEGVFADLGMVVFLVLTGPVLSASFDAPWIVASWSALAGIVTGAAFPALLNRAAKNKERDERKAAPAMEAADHIGAAFGALITGVIWVPVYGITTTCLLFAAFKTASLLGQFPLKSIRSNTMPSNPMPDDRASHQNHVCEWQYVYLLDNFLRPFLHNPDKLFGPYVRQGMTVLDVGCGRGFASLGLARLVGEQGLVISADLQPEMLAMVEKRANKAGLEKQIQTHLCKSDRIGVEQKMDFVLAFWMAHEVPDMRHFLTEIFGLLKLNRQLFLAEPKGHVSRRDFELTVEEAQGVGFHVLDRPRIRFSRTVLLSKTTGLN